MNAYEILSSHLKMIKADLNKLINKDEPFYVYALVKTERRQKTNKKDAVILAEIEKDDK